MSSFFSSGSRGISSGLPSNVYIIELSRWSISNDGTNPLATTQGINEALVWAKTNNYNYVKLPAGTYTVAKGVNTGVYPYQIRDTSASGCIIPQSDTTLDLYGCTIQKETNYWAWYVIIDIDRARNVTILGGTIVGDKTTHDFTTIGSPYIHENANAIRIGNGSENITLENMEIKDCPGYNIDLTGTYSQIELTNSTQWEAGTFNSTTGVASTNANFMRMNRYFQISTLEDIAIGGGISDNATTNGGYFAIWGDGYSSFGTRTGGGPVNLSKVVFELYCYDATDVFKGVRKKRANDAIYINTLPAGTTQFKLAVRYVLADIIPSTINVQINAFTYASAIVIRNCKIHSSYSLAIAFTGAQQVLIENCEMYNIGYSLTAVGRQLYPFPMAIDIEDGGNINQKIIIRNNVFRDNEALHISAYHVRNLLIENNTFGAVTNIGSGGVNFIGSRGSNLISRNNSYHCVIGNGQGNVLFQNDLFIDATLELQYETTYEGCVFENIGFILNIVTYSDWVASTAYTAGSIVLPTVKTGTWLTNPLYYVCTTAGTATATQPTWQTDMTDTTDAGGGVWKANRYYVDKDYEKITFRSCTVNYTKVDGLIPWITRRGAVDFSDCKFYLTNAAGFFTDNSTIFDYVLKNSFKFTKCEFNSINKFNLMGDKITFSETTFNGESGGGGSGSNSYFKANTLIVQNCKINNYDLKLTGRANTNSKSVIFANNTIMLNKTQRVFGVNNEGVLIRNYENVFVENNKATMVSSTVVARALTIYIENFLKMTGNYFESATSSNKLELFGAFRDATYTNVAPVTTTVVIDKNFAKLYAILADATYTAQVDTTIGDGVTAIT